MWTSDRTALQSDHALIASYKSCRCRPENSGRARHGGAQTEQVVTVVMTCVDIIVDSGIDADCDTCVYRDRRKHLQGNLNE